MVVAVPAIAIVYLLIACGWTAVMMDTGQEEEADLRYAASIVTGALWPFTLVLSIVVAVIMALVRR